MSKSVNNMLSGAWEYVPARLRARLDGWLSRPQYPLVLQVEQTHRCNLKCVMCSHGQGTIEDWPDLTLEQFKNLVDQFKGPEAPSGYDRLEAIELQGIGEPMLHKDTIPMIEYARSKGIEVFFISNMTVLNEKLAEALVAAGPIYIIASVDSIDPETFQDIRRGVNFQVLEKVLKNLELIQRVKMARNSTRPEIHVNSILMKRTLHQVPTLISKLKDLGVSRIYFLELIDFTMDPELTFSDDSKAKEQSLRTLPMEEQQKIADDLRALGTADCEIIIRGLGSDQQAFRTDSILTCDDLWEKPYITSEGIVKPCCYLPDKTTLPMGDINKQSFDEIWFGQAYQNLRWSHITNDAPGHCKWCFMRNRTVVRRSALHGHDLPPNPPRTPVFMGKDRFTLEGSRKLSQKT